MTSLCELLKPTIEKEVSNILKFVTEKLFKFKRHDMSRNVRPEQTKKCRNKSYEKRRILTNLDLRTIIHLQFVENGSYEIFTTVRGL